MIPFSAEPGRSPNFLFYNFFLPLKNRTCLFINPFSPHVGRTKTDLDSGFHAVDSGFQVLDSSPCKGNLDSGFQSELVGFRNPGAAFRIPKPRIFDSTSKNFAGSEVRIPGLTSGDLYYQPQKDRTILIQPSHDHQY